MKAFFKMLLRIRQPRKQKKIVHGFKEKFNYRDRVTYIKLSNKRKINQNN